MDTTTSIPLVSCIVQMSSGSGETVRWSSSMATFGGHSHIDTTSFLHIIDELWWWLIHNKQPYMSGPTLMYVWLMECFSTLKHTVFVLVLVQIHGQ